MQNAGGSMRNAQNAGVADVDRAESEGGGPPATARGRALVRLARRWPLLATLREDREANSGWGMPGFQAVAFARLGAWADSADAGSRDRFVGRRLARMGSAFVRNVYGIELPPTVKLGRRVRIAHQSGIVIHPNAVIGDDCVLRQNVTLGAGRGDAGSFWKQAPTLGSGVSVGANAVVVGNVRIGDNATIGPNATVLTHVPAGATVLAPPPRIVRPAALHEGPE